MSDSYVGEIRMFGGSFAPEGWAFCNGQLLSISENSTLYQLIGTTYGGDGQNTFGLPNLQGRLPIDQGAGYNMGQTAGTETVTLVSSQLPSHTHPFNATTNSGNVASPSGALPATTPSTNPVYATASSAPSTAMAAQGIGPSSGGSQPHDNMMPYLAVTFIISLYGVYPSQS